MRNVNSQAGKRSLLVITRFSPLGNSGTGTYLFSILNHLHQHGITLYVCWSERPDIAARRGWWFVPKDLAAIATLLMPGTLALGRLRLFPSVFLDPIKATLRRAIKGVLQALGLRPRPGIHSPQTGEPAPAAIPALNPYAWDRPPDDTEHAFFGGAIARLRPDALMFNYCWMSPITQSLADPARFLKITLTYDLRHILSTLVNGEIQWTEGEMMSKEVETDFLRLADLIVAIRGDDAGIFRGLLPGKEIIVAHPAFTTCPSLRVPLPNRCLFVAADNQANREGILWFLEKAWPKVRAANPEAQLHICGTICKALTTEQPGVVRLGFVDSLETVYAESSVVIVPLLRGSGVKIKLMEALARGKACVSTPIGTEGIPVLDSCVAVARTEDEFAAHIVCLLQDEARRRCLEQRSASVIAEQFSPEACYGALLAQIQQHRHP